MGELTASQHEYLERQSPGRVVALALTSLLERDGYLLEIDVNERSISYRFGMYLQALLPQWDVECEFNRDGIEPKRLGHFSSPTA
ncbi:MAG: hypothetical protein WAW69_20360 [Polaromonas sp.]|jgi:hypothetical protein